MPRKQMEFAYRTGANQCGTGKISMKDQRESRNNAAVLIWYANQAERLEGAALCGHVLLTGMLGRSAGTSNPETRSGTTGMRR